MSGWRTTAANSSLGKRTSCPSPPLRSSRRQGRRCGPAAVRQVDDVLLRDQLCLSADQHVELVTAHALLTARRVTRGASRVPPER